MKEAQKCQEPRAPHDYPTTLLLAATTLVIASFLVRVTVDSDTWWQVAIGRDILSNWSVPSVDRFAAAGWGRSYHDSHWLFQVLLALADGVGGMKAVSLAMVALWGATLLFCYRALRRWLAPAACCLLVFLVAMACSDRFIPRPEIVSYFMVALYYLLLQEGKFGTVRHLALFFVLQVIWTNCHGLFVIGPFMAGCYLVAAAMRQEDRSALPATAKLLGLITLATLVTPFGLDGWRYALLLFQEAGAGSPEHFDNLVELAPTFGALARSYPDFWFYLVLLIAAACSSLASLLRGESHYGRLLLVAALLAASLTGRRNIPLFALCAAPLLAEHLFRTAPKVTGSRHLTLFLALTFLALVYLPLSGKYYAMFNYPLRFGIGAAQESYSTGLPLFLRRIQFSGQLYGPAYLGGYSLYHGYRPIVDGRWEVYDLKLLDQILAAPFAQSSWEWLVASYDIKGVMVSYREFDTDAHLKRLNSDKRFQMVYSDNAVGFFLRTEP